MKYCFGPALDLIESYNKMGDDAQYEIDEQHKMLASKKLDIAKLVKENNKFLAGAGSKSSWKAYEQRLANERITNKRLIENLNVNVEMEMLITEGRKCTYEEYKRSASNFAGD